MRDLKRERATYRAWYARNKQRVAEKVKRWQQANPGNARLRSLKWYRNNREKVAALLRFKKYGVSPEEYIRLNRSQENRCAICQKPFVKTPLIDHCHATGKVRGLLCRSCNTILGAWQDSIEIFQRAISYLSK